MSEDTSLNLSQEEAPELWPIDASLFDMDDDWKSEELNPNPHEEYRVLLRTLQRHQGFGLLFVQCSPAEGTQIIQKIRRDLPQKTIEVLKFDQPIEDGNFYQRVKTFLQDKAPVDVLFVQGLEHSLYDYEETKRSEGWDSKSLYSYSWKGVPRLLINLNQQRENFRENFNTCFVFLIPLFVLKYLIHRAPDFFDWRSGVFKFSTDKIFIKKATHKIFFELRQLDLAKYELLGLAKQSGNIIEIKTLLEEPELTLEDKVDLYAVLGTRYVIANEYEKALDVYEKVVKLNPDWNGGWYIRGRLMLFLERYQEAIASFDKAIEIDPDDHESLLIRGFLLLILRRHSEALDSFRKVLEVKPDDYKESYVRELIFMLQENQDAIDNLDQNIAVALQKAYAKVRYQNALHSALLEQIDLALEQLQQAIALDPEYREMAKTDTDFDGIRQDERFQAVLQE